MFNIATSKPKISKKNDETENVCFFFKKKEDLQKLQNFLLKKTKTEKCLIRFFCQDFWFLELIFQKCIFPKTHPVSYRSLISEKILDKKSKFSKKKLVV